MVTTFQHFLGCCFFLNLIWNLSHLSKIPVKLLHSLSSQKNRVLRSIRRAAFCVVFLQNKWKKSLSNWIWQCLSNRAKSIKNSRKFEPPTQPWTSPWFENEIPNDLFTKVFSTTAATCVVKVWITNEVADFQNKLSFERRTLEVWAAAKKCDYLWWSVNCSLRPPSA